MSRRLDLDRFVDDVKNANREADAQRAVDDVLARTVSEPARVLEGLGEPRVPGLDTLYRSDDLTILNVVWAPLMLCCLTITTCGRRLAIYTGREDNIIWERRGAAAQAVRAASLSEQEGSRCLETRSTP